MTQPVYYKRLLLVFKTDGSLVWSSLRNGNLFIALGLQFASRIRGSPKAFVQSQSQMDISCTQSINSFSIQNLMDQATSLIYSCTTHALRMHASSVLCMLWNIFNDEGNRNQQQCVDIVMHMQYPQSNTQMAFISTRSLNILYWKGLIATFTVHDFTVVIWHGPVIKLWEL